MEQGILHRITVNARSTIPGLLTPTPLLSALAYVQPKFLPIGRESYTPFVIYQYIHHYKLVWDNSIAVGNGADKGHILISEKST